jgi:hypothetical protein
MPSADSCHMLTRHISSSSLAFRRTSFGREKPSTPDTKRSRYSVIRHDAAIRLVWTTRIRININGVHGGAVCASMYRRRFIVQPCGEAEDLSQPQMHVAAWYERICAVNHERLGLFLHGIGTCGLTGRLYGNLLVTTYKLWFKRWKSRPGQPPRIQPCIEALRRDVRPY